MAWIRKFYSATQKEGEMKRLELLTDEELSNLTFDENGLPMDTNLSHLTRMVAVAQLSKDQKCHKQICEACAERVAGKRSGE